MKMVNWNFLARVPPDERLLAAYLVTLFIAMAALAGADVSGGREPA
jgi:hypothetical protein